MPTQTSPPLPPPPPSITPSPEPGSIGGPPPPTPQQSSPTATPTPTAPQPTPLPPPPAQQPQQPPAPPPPTTFTPPQRPAKKPGEPYKPNPYVTTIFVGGITPTTTLAEFRNLITRLTSEFPSFAPLTVKRISFPTELRSRRSRGYAFIQIDPDANTRRLIERINNQRLHGSWLRATPGGENLPAIPPDRDTVALFSLPPAVTEDEIISWIEPIARVFSVHILYDPNTRFPRVYGAHQLRGDETGPIYEGTHRGGARAFVKLRDRTDTADVILALSGTVKNGYVVRATYANPNEPIPSHGAYTFDIPGLSDIIRIPAMESVALRLQRIARMRTHNSTVPAALNWCTSLINHLDDAQDLLFTALVLGKPLLRRLPARLLPGLGWVLLANDALNLMTALLAIPLIGRLPKRRAFSALDLNMFGRARRLRKVTDFMTKTAWAGFAIQAAQASTNVTQWYFETFTPEGRAAIEAGRRVPGYGLSLGPLMGLSSEIFWTPFRYSQGDTEFTVRMPPPSDPLGKALRFLIQQLDWPFYRDGISNEDQTLLAAAHAAAIAIVRDAGIPFASNKFDHEANRSFYQFTPTNAASSAALAQEFGIPTQNQPYRFASSTDFEEWNVYNGWFQFGTPFAIAKYAPTNSRLYKANQGEPDRWDRHAFYMRDAFGKTRAGDLTSALTLDAGLSTFSLLSGPDAEPVPNFAQEELAIMHAIEYGILPPHPPTNDETRAFSSLAAKNGALAGRRAANPDDLSRAAYDVFGGWQPGRPTAPEITVEFEGGISGTETLPPGVTPPTSTP